MWSIFMWLGRIMEISRDPFKIKTIKRQNNRCSNIPQSANVLRMIKGLKRDSLKYKLSLAAKLQHVWATGWFWALICDECGERKTIRENRLMRSERRQPELLGNQSHRGTEGLVLHPSCCVCVCVRVSVCVSEHWTAWGRSGAAVDGGVLLDLVHVLRVWAEHTHTTCALLCSQNVSRRRRPYIRNFLRVLGIVAVCPFTLFW